MANELPLDVSASVQNRLQMASIISAWESARLHLEVSAKNKAEARKGTTVRLIQANELRAMRQAVEATRGRLKDKEVPAKSFLASKLEQIELNQPAAENLTEVASLEDSELEAFSAVVDPATNVLKIKAGKALTTLPANAEELRLRHRRIGLCWDFLATRHALRSWLQGNITDLFRRFSHYVLGSQVAGLSAGGVSPSWSLVLNFEGEARKAAYRWLRDGEEATLESSLQRVMADTEILNRHLVIPFTLNAQNRASAWTEKVVVESENKGGKGKRKGVLQHQWKKSNDNDKPANGKWRKTGDGKPICFAYNKRSGCSAGGSCKFPCQRCQGKHPYYNCQLVKRPSDTSGRPTPNAANDH